MRVHAARGGKCPKPLESAVVCALLFVGLLAPRVAVQLHHHPGGDHGHVHLSSSAGHGHHREHASPSAHEHHRETYQASSEADPHSSDRHAHDVPTRRQAAHEATGFAHAEDVDHLHTYDPYQRTLAPAPIRAQRTLTTTPIVPAVASDPSLRSVIAPCARGPPPRTRI